MSLTSYRAAPSRATCLNLLCMIETIVRETLFIRGFIRFGSDLLSHALRRSTIGATALNCRVRDGTGCFACAMTTKPKKSSDVVQVAYDLSLCMLLINVSLQGLTCLAFTRSNQAYRAISIGQLNALQHLHLRPIDVVVFHGPQGRPCFWGGFPLRCLQRLSCPIIATLHCCWRNNRSTSGSFTPVLSY